MLRKITHSIRKFIGRIRPSHNIARRTYKLSSMLDELRIPVRADKKRESIERALKNTVFYAATDRTSIFQAAPVAAKLDGDTVMYHLSKLTMSDINQLEQYIINTLSDLIRKRKIPRRLSLAVDSTDYKFYGRYHGPYTIHTKDGFVFRYIMISVVAHKVAVPILVLPVSQFDSAESLLKRLLTAVCRLRIKVIAIYMDRGFYAVGVVKLLKKLNMRFVIGAPRTSGIKKILDEVPRDGTFYTRPYVMRGSTGCKEEVTLFIRWNKTKKEWFIAIGYDVGIRDVRRYSRRWGIETEFRLIKEPRIKTTTVNYLLRYFFVLVSTLIYLFYAVIRLGEIPDVLAEIEELVENEAVTLYTVRRYIRSRLEAAQHAVL